MKKYILTVIISVFVGFLLSNYILGEYQNIDLKPVFNETVTAYLIQQGVYSNLESMQSNTSHLSDYIYSVIDNMYYVYIGITLDVDNVEKLQNYYKNKGIKTIVKTTALTEKDFISSLRIYDAVIRETSDPATIKEVCRQILQKYQGE